MATYQKTYTLQSEQVAANPLITLVFLNLDEVIFTKKSYVDQENANVWVIGKDADLLHAISFDYPVKNFKLQYDDLVLFQSDIFVTKVEFSPPLNTNTYYKFRFSFDQATELFDSNCIEASGQLPDQLKPAPLLKCSVLADQHRTFVKADFTVEMQISEVLSMLDTATRRQYSRRVSYQPVVK